MIVLTNDSILALQVTALAGNYMEGWQCHSSQCQVESQRLGQSSCRTGNTLYEDHSNVA